MQRFSMQLNLIIIGGGASRRRPIESLIAGLHQPRWQNAEQRRHCWRALAGKRDRS